MAVGKVQDVNRAVAGTGGADRDEIEFDEAEWEVVMMHEVRPPQMPTIMTTIATRILLLLILVNLLAPLCFLGCDPLDLLSLMWCVTRWMLSWGFSVTYFIAAMLGVFFLFLLDRLCVVWADSSVAKRVLVMAGNWLLTDGWLGCVAPVLELIVDHGLYGWTSRVAALWDRFAQLRAGNA
eukprot:CAMPEP_0206519998 /NCGR_PEP_ID=MMETSP0324_2-20121206/65517_1 /ASSEMBLY_ACC=CAM_ASM_000836 /TAXON_ID=2866 /ORGANISM="Crypthecodinium cohnii, Strain Seligo" /LENGTH=179 /DNA_ID=CAMNT_0054013671 /DNA_START=120 /DNA_END=659 /DNA_ORIENTATION=-